MRRLKASCSALVLAVIAQQAAHAQSGPTGAGPDAPLLTSPTRASPAPPSSTAPASPASASPFAAPDAGSSTLGEIVVTAQKRSESIQSVPISIEAFSGKDLKNLGVQSSSDISKFTPNVEIGLPGGQGNQPLLTIRGIGLNDTNTNNAGPNGIYVDEVYLSAPSSQSFSTFDLERVEVLKGPQGTLYGRNSSGGAINFITNKPTDATTADFRFSYSSFDTTSFEGAIGGKIADGLDGRLAFVKHDSDGYFYNDLTHNHENGANDGALRGELLWNPTAALKVLLNVHGGYVYTRQQEYRHIGTLQSAFGAPCTTSQSAAGQCVDLFGTGTPSGFYDGAFDVQSKLRVSNEGASVRAEYDAGYLQLLSLTSYENNYKRDPEDSDATALRLVEQTFGVKSDAATQEFRASHSETKYRWVAGAYYLNENLLQNQSIGQLLDGDLVFGPGAVDGVALIGLDHSRQITNAYALFGQGEYNITSKLKFIAGGRFTDETKTFDYFSQVQAQEGGINSFSPLQTIEQTRRSLTDENFSYRVALDYTFDRNTLAYGSIASGFKSGGFNGGFLSADPTEADRQLPPIKPEKVTAYEVGVKSTLFDRRLTIDGALFYNDYTNMQVAEYVSPVVPGGNIVSVLDNAKQAHTEGVDLSIIARPLRRLTFTANVGLLEAKVDEFLSSESTAVINYSGNQLALAPHVTGLLLATYEVPLGEDALDLQASGSYKSHQFFDITNLPLASQNAYWLADLRAAYEFKHLGLEIAGFIHNVTGKEYFIYAGDFTNPLGFAQGVTGTPRSFGVELNYHY